MDDEAELDEERRRNRINMASASQKIKKSQKKQRRKELFKLALKDVVRQIKVTILIVAVVSILILILCTSAWYILESNEKNDKKQKIKSLVTLMGMNDNEYVVRNYEA